jgi:hypothetical protein
MPNLEDLTLRMGLFPGNSRGHMRTRFAANVQKGLAAHLGAAVHHLVAVGVVFRLQVVQHGGLGHAGDHRVLQKALYVGRHAPKRRAPAVLDSFLSYTTVAGVAAGSKDPTQQQD